MKTVLSIINIVSRKHLFTNFYHIYVTQDMEADEKMSVVVILNIGEKTK